LQSLQRLERFFSAQRICENADFAAFPATYDQRRMRPPQQPLQEPFNAAP
jgi:hypothetical protein